MSKFFSPDNSVFSIINKAIDTLWLGFLWTLLGPAIIVAGLFFSSNVTMFFVLLAVGAFLTGPSSSALYYATVKVTRRGRSYATKEFFSSFKSNFIIGGAASFIIGVYTYLMIYDWQYAIAARHAGEGMGNVMLIVSMVGIIFGLLTFSWIFPILSRFTLNVTGLFRNSIIIAGKHFVRSLLLIFIWIVTGLLCYQFYEYLIYGLPLVPLVPGVVALIRSFVIEPAFKKYLSEREGEPEETGIDDWYRE